MDKKYYWIKLRTDIFGREDIDFLMSQKMAVNMLFCIKCYA